MNGLVAEETGLCMVHIQYEKNRWWFCWLFSLTNTKGKLTGTHDKISDITGCANFYEQTTPKLIKLNINKTMNTSNIYLCDVSMQYTYNNIYPQTTTMVYLQTTAAEHDSGKIQENLVPRQKHWEIAKTDDRSVTPCAPWMLCPNVRFLAIQLCRDVVIWAGWQPDHTPTCGLSLPRLLPLANVIDTHIFCNTWEFGFL